MKKKLYIVFTFFILLLPLYKVEAKTLNDMYKELDTLKNQKKIADNQKKLTKSQIASIENSINETNQSIENTRNEVKVANENIVKSTEEIKRKKEETKELLKFLQKSNGENVYLEYIMEADSYTELIYRYSVVNQISSYNTKVMSELEDMINKLEQSKIQLAEKEKKLENQRIELGNKKASLNTQLVGVIEGATSIEEDIVELQKEITYYKDTLKCDLNEDITKCASIAYSAGFKYPLVSGYVTSLFSNRWGTFHYGQDYGTAEGTKVYSIANGRVAKVTYRSTCGGNIVYIYHNVNGKPYTSIYMHLLYYIVNVGDSVTADTVIGYSGGGYQTAAARPTYCPSRGGKGYDKCTCGAHLHFQIVEGHRIAAVSNYSFNPVEIFPKLTAESVRWNSR